MLRAQLVLAALLSSRPRPLAAPRASRVRLQDQKQQQPAERLTDVQFAARLTLLASLRESSDGKEISRLVGELGELNVKEHGMSIFAYSRANDHESRACGRAGALDAARELLERSADTYGVVLGERAWRSAMQACGKAGAPEAALALLERAIAAGAASTSVYGAAMHAVAFQPLEDPAPAATQCVELLARMHANGVSLDLGIGNAVLHACQRADDWETVREKPCADASLSARECP
jgi:hypothetical protein